MTLGRRLAQPAAALGFHLVLAILNVALAFAAALGFLLALAILAAAARLGVGQVHRQAGRRQAGPCPGRQIPPKCTRALLYVTYVRCEQMKDALKKHCGQDTKCEQE